MNYKAFTHSHAVGCVQCIALRWPRFATATAVHPWSDVLCWATKMSRMFETGALDTSAGARRLIPWCAACAQDLVEAVLNLMGLKADAVGENDNLAALGIDSMQLMEASPSACPACMPADAGPALIACIHGCIRPLSRKSCQLCIQAGCVEQQE